MRHTDRCVAHNVQGKNSRILDSTGRRSIANAVIVSPPSHYVTRQDPGQDIGLISKGQAEIRDLTRDTKR